MKQRLSCRCQSYIRPGRDQDDATTTPAAECIHVLLAETNVVLYAINPADHNCHVALLQVTSRVVDAKVVYVGAARDIRDDDVLFENWRAERHAREPLVGESVNEDLEIHTARS
jgi:hypothetical protein